MNLQHIPSGLMQPRQDNDLITNRKTIKRRRREWTDFEPGVGRAFGSLLGRGVTLF